MKQVFSGYSATISELKKNPTALLDEAEGVPVAILDHNTPAAYFIPAETYEWLMDRLEDSELAKIVIGRAGEKKDAIEVNIDTEERKQT